MAIALVSHTDSAATDSVSSVTTSVTVSSGSNRILLVAVQISASGAQSDTSSVTWNTSENLTLAKRTVNGTGPYWTTELWYLVNPTATTANVVATWANTFNDRAIAYCAMVLSGVDQVSPIDATAGSTGTNSTLSTTITTVAANAWVIDSAMGRDDGGVTVGGSQTLLSNRVAGQNFEGCGVSAIEGIATPGATSDTWTQGGVGPYDWSLSAISLKPDGSTPYVAAYVQGLVNQPWYNRYV